MEERKLTSLFFGNVVLESHILGTAIRVYAPDMRSYSERLKPDISLSVPLDEVRGKLESDHAEALSKKILGYVAEELDRSYPGGCSRAEEELQAWLVLH